MAEPSPKPAEPSSAGPAQIWKKITDSLQTALAIGGAIAAALGVSQKERWALWIGSAVLLLSALWFVFARWRRGRRRRKLQPAPVTPTSGAYIRGLLPFGQGESLLGRQGDLRQLLTKVSSSEFRFGYLSGEAGCGKTSLLRAGLLAEAEKAPTSLAVVYIPKPGTDPVATIAKAVRQKLGDPPLGDSATLHDFLVVAQARLQGRRLLVVCDQFEEFFLANRTPRSREPFLRAVGDCYVDVDLAAGLLFSLRKEFVDDLQDFQKAGIPQPLDTRFSYRLRNWDTTEALNVLREAARSDDVPFAEALESEIIRDLEQDGEVRPVELQIVAYHLREERIYELGPYNTAGRARGILKSYVRQVIEPSGAKTPEIERQLARHLLRSLCAERADAKRPVGLRFDEIHKLVRVTLRTAGQEDLVKDSEQYEESLRRILQRCQAAYLVIPEDEERYNLVHDYIVRPIREATSDIEPVEEQANRMLDQYLEDQRRRPNIIVPRGPFRFIVKYASADNKAAEPALRLLRRTRRIRTWRATGTAAALIFTASLVKPPEIKFQEVARLPTHNRYSGMSSDGQLAFLFENHSSYLRLWRVEQPWGQHIAIKQGFLGVRISSRSRFVAGTTSDGFTHLWQLGKEQAILAQLNLSLLWSHRITPYFYDFSPDERWLLTLEETGDLHLLPVTDALHAPFEPRLKLSPLNRKKPPFYRFSPRGNYLALWDSSSALLISDLKGVPRTAKAAIIPRHGYPGSLVFSNDDSFLALTGQDGYFYLENLKHLPDPTVTRLQLPPLPEDSLYSASFTPDGRWLAVTAPTGEIYLLDETKAPIQGQRPILAAPRENSLPTLRVVSAFKFSPDGKWGATPVWDGSLRVGSVEQWTENQTSLAFPPSKSGVTFSFSPRSDWISGQTMLGGVYVWKPSSVPDLEKPRGHIDGYSRIRWCTDDKHFLWVGRTTALWGSVDDDSADVIASGESRIHDFAIAQQPRELLLFVDDGVLIFKRQLSLWGIPLHTFSLPPFEERPQEF